MTNEIKEGSHVITSKGNHGKVMVVKHTTAMVKIGNTVYEIDKTNLVNITDGSIFKVTYTDVDNVKHTTQVLIKHGTALYVDGRDHTHEHVLNVLKNQVNKQITIVNISIP